MTSDDRPWADIPPEILGSIYAKLLPSHVDGTVFGSVCSNWHRLHCTAALSNPLPLETLSDIQVAVDAREAAIHYQETNGQSLAEHLGYINFSEIVAKAGPWLLLSLDGRVYCCFNPLLRYPYSCRGLPSLSMYYFTYRNPRPIKGGFSALPTAPDWMILVVYGTRYFSTLRRGNWFWRTYDFSLNGKRPQICLGVGYRDDKFFCLFERGDMLICSANERRMLAATKPLPPEQLRQLDSLRVVVVAPMTTKDHSRDRRDHEEAGGVEVEEVMVVSWEREYWTSREDNSFRLATLKRDTVMMPTSLLRNDDDDGDDREEVLLEEGVVSDTMRVILVKDELPLKTNHFEGLCHLILVTLLFIVSGCLLEYFIYT